MRTIAIVLVGLFTTTSAYSAKYDLGRTGTSVKSFEVTCGTTATPIEFDTDATHTSLLCGQLATTPIFIGGPDVNTTTLGFPICSDVGTCLDKTVELSANNAYCRVSTGTQILECLAVIE